MALLCAISVSYAGESTFVVSYLIPLDLVDFNISVYKINMYVGVILHAAFRKLTPAKQSSQVRGG
jgi:hypothetical protein